MWTASLDFITIAKRLIKSGGCYSVRCYSKMCNQCCHSVPIYFVQMIRWFLETSEKTYSSKSACEKVVAFHLWHPYITVFYMNTYVRQTCTVDPIQSTVNVIAIAFALCCHSTIAGVPIIDTRWSPDTRHSKMAWFFWSSFALRFEYHLYMYSIHVYSNYKIVVKYIASYAWHNAYVRAYVIRQYTRVAARIRV